MVLTQPRGQVARLTGATGPTPDRPVTADGSGWRIQFLW
jgi:hypothetical protein